MEATEHRMRPILLTAAAASLALIPIAREIFWGPMAYAMMGGIIVGTLLTLLFLPALYVAWFRITRSPRTLDRRQFARARPSSALQNSRRAEARAGRVDRSKSLPSARCLCEGGAWTEPRGNQLFNDISHDRAPMTSSANRIAIFIDGPNLYATSKTLGFDIDFRRLLNAFDSRGRLLRAFYYTAIVEIRSTRPSALLSIGWITTGTPS